MAEERDVVDIDDAADKSEAESSIKWTYHCDSENSTDLGESYKSFAPAMSSLAQVADKLPGIFQTSFPALESLKTIRVLAGKRCRKGLQIQFIQLLFLRRLVSATR